MHVANASTYGVRLDPNVLNHMGLNLYGNFAAVLSEALATPRMPIPQTSP